MFEKKNKNTSENLSTTLNSVKPKESAKVVIGEGVKIKGEITNANEVQIDGQADVTMTTENLVVGGTGELKGTITSNNIDVWGKLKGHVNALGTLSIQELGSVSGSIEYQNMQIKLGGKLKGEVKVSEKVKKIGDFNKPSSSLQESLKEKTSSKE